MKGRKGLWLPVACLLCLLGGCSGAQPRQERTDIVYLSVLAGQSTSDAGIEDMIDDKVREILPHVRLDWECMDWGEHFDAELNARFAAGDIPDILVGKAQDAVQYYATGNLAAIDGDLLRDLDENAKESVTVDGVAYGIPYNSWYQGVIYNKTIFEEYGLEVPSTREDLEKIVDVLEEHGVVPFASHFQESWAVGNTTMQFMLNNLFSEHPRWGDEFRRGEQNYSGNDTIEDCMRCNSYILEHSWEDAMTIDQAVCDSRFDQREAAMYLTGTWSLQFVNQYQKADDYGIFPFPNLDGTSKLIRETNMTFMKSATTKYQEEVDKIFELLLSDEELMGEILNYTQTYGVKKGYESQFTSCLQPEIDIYEAKGQTIEAAVGNTQLLWVFQNEVAAQQLLWLQDNQTLEEVLAYADSQREQSILE